MAKPVDWTVGISARVLLSSARKVSGFFSLEGAIPREVRYRQDGQKITSYIVYDDNGRAIKRVDISGKSHAGILTPHVVEYKHNQNPAGDIFVQAEKVVRPATLEEIP